MNFAEICRALVIFSSGDTVRYGSGSFIKQLMPLSLLQMEMDRGSVRRALTAEVIFGGQAVRSDRGDRVAKCHRLKGT